MLGFSSNRLARHVAKLVINSGTVGGGNATITSLTFANPLVPDMENGGSRKVAVTDNFTLAPPINPTEGAELLLRLDVDGTNRQFSLDPAILVPSESRFTSPHTLSANTFSFVKFIYQGTTWAFVSFVGEYERSV